MTETNTTQEYEFSALGIKLTIMTGTVTSLSLYSNQENSYHTHAWYELFMPIEKPLTLHFETHNTVLTPDKIIILAPQTVHYAETNAEHPAFGLSFSIEFPEKTESSRKVSAFFTFDPFLCLPADPTGSQLLHFLHMALMNQQSALCGSFLLSFLLHEAELQQAAPSKTPEFADSKIGRIYKIENLLYQYYTDKLSLQEIADILHISTRQVSRIIHKQYGVGYREKLHILRMETAARLLMSGKTVAEVAAHIGYHSVSAFYTAFKRHYQITPSAYRDEHMHQTSLPEQQILNQPEDQ